MRNPNNIEPNDALEYLRDTQDAVFLFKQEIVDYLDSLYKKAHLMRSLQKKSEPLPVGSERTALCEQESKLVKELVDELPKLKDVFGPYLRFKVWK